MISICFVDDKLIKFCRIQSYVGLNRFGFCTKFLCLTNMYFPIFCISYKAFVLIVFCYLSCDGQEICSIEGTAEVFGDYCPENSKYLDATYKCLLNDQNGTVFSVNFVRVCIFRLKAFIFSLIALMRYFSKIVHALIRD